MGIQKRRRSKTNRKTGSTAQPKKSNRKNNTIKKNKLNKVVNFIKENWDDKKSLNANYSKIGISTDPNKAVNNNPVNEEVFNQELEYLKTQLEAFEEEKVKRVFFAKKERKYWARLIEKYGDDYKAMAKDIKLNNYQHTKKKCEKKCKLYHELYGNNIANVESDDDDVEN